MSSIKAIFTKQVLDIFKNREVLIQFVLFPLVAFAMTELVAKGNDNIPDNMFILMMSSVFVGMSMILTMASIIAEDKERKSLRVLVIAGVKPHEYLLGTGGAIFAASVLVSAVFGFMGSFTAGEFGRFMLLMMLGSIA